MIAYICLQYDIMILNPLWWDRQFKEEFIPQVHSLVETLEVRLLPTFDNIGQEAEKKAKEEWERLGSVASLYDFDEAALAEKAHDVGLDYYFMMNGLRQGLINMFSVTLYHLYEQQKMIFHRKEILAPEEEDDRKLIKHEIFQNKLQEYEINITQFKSWFRIEELRLIANTIKHAAGDSAEKLHAWRPDLFKAPSMSESLPALPTFPTSSMQVYRPLMGEDIYLGLKDIKIYANAVEQFWNELSDKIMKIERIGG